MPTALLNLQYTIHRNSSTSLALSTLAHTHAHTTRWLGGNFLAGHLAGINLRPVQIVKVFTDN
ncbi:hypothetical protein E2C01_008653 [Portunus trituberculatus]|uniref:Uncharacterized protein n=1 Tax=Portunus trituberculatus TaxID=210409 RepID=A0A5B7D2X7_PORTR|nr:hypothetical protein [Portunus trituberculatus]